MPSLKQNSTYICIMCWCVYRTSTSDLFDVDETADLVGQTSTPFVAVNSDISGTVPSALISPSHNPNGDIKVCFIGVNWDVYASSNNPNITPI